MITERIEIGVEVERRAARSRWQTHVWRPVALRPGRSDLADWSELTSGDEVTRFFAGSDALLLHAADTQVYKDNLESPAPSVYVVLRRGRSPSGWLLHRVTVDPSEAHAHVDVGEDLVEALPMPPAIFARTAEFVARHHVERRHWKRQRDRADPEALAARRDGGDDD